MFTFLWKMVPNTQNMHFTFLTFNSFENWSQIEQDAKTTCKNTIKKHNLKVSNTQHASAFNLL